MVGAHGRVLLSLGESSKKDNTTGNALLVPKDFNSCLPFRRSDERD